MYVFQQILAQERAKSPIINNGWIGYGNLVYEANRNPTIDEAKVRAVVRGNLPIVFAPDANLPPNTSPQ